MSKKYKKVYRVLNYIEHLLLVICTVTGCVSISAFAELEKKKRHYKILSLAKSKLNSAEVLISKALIVSNISHCEFVLVNNVPKEFVDMNEEIKNSNGK